MNGRGRRKSFWNRFRSLQGAIVFFFSVLTILAEVLLLGTAFRYTKRAIYENSVESMQQMTEQVNAQVESYIDYMENISSIAARNNDLTTYLFGSGDEEDYAEERERVLAQFETILESRSDICNIAAVSVGGRELVNTGADSLTSYIDIEDLEWYQDTLSSKSGISVSSSHVQNAISSSYEWVITLSRSLVNARTGEQGGIFFIDLNYSAISDLCEEGGIGENGYVFILDEEGNIVYHPRQQLIYGGLFAEDVDAILSCEEDYLELESDGEDMLYTTYTSETTGWTVVEAAYSSELLRGLRYAQYIYLFAAALIFLAVIAFSAYLAAQITKPLRRLQGSMAKVQEGDFTDTQIEPASSNEVGRLTESFNIMTNRLQELMEKEAYEQEAKRRSDFLALQEQIKPHFLYNTLDSIIWMAEAGENDAVIRMTAALARLLRQSISQEEDLITIRGETDYVESYLIIQKMRYKDKLDYRIEMEESILEESIVRFTLQPLAENAIYHGLKYRENGGMLTIRGYRAEDCVVLEVADDGIGMTESQLGRLFDEPRQKKESGGLGVWNVQRRLRLYYGAQYGLSYESAPGKGTTVTIRVPASAQNSRQDAAAEDNRTAEKTENTENADIAEKPYAAGKPYAAEKPEGMTAAGGAEKSEGMTAAGGTGRVKGIADDE